MLPRSATAQNLTEISTSLQAGRGELEQAIFFRVQSIGDPGTGVEQGYAENLRCAISAALDYGFAAIEPGRSPSVPSGLLGQSRLSARSGVSLDIVLRRYAAGYALFGDRVLGKTAAVQGIRSSDLTRLHRVQATALDRLLAAVSKEYAGEVQRCSESGERHRMQLVERLLAGELLDPDELAYDFDSWHLGLILVGADAEGAIRNLAAAVDRRLLMVNTDRNLTWGWAWRSPASLAWIK